MIKILKKSLRQRVLKSNPLIDTCLRLTFSSITMHLRESAPDQSHYCNYNLDLFFIPLIPAVSKSVMRPAAREFVTVNSQHACIHLSTEAGWAQRTLLSQ